MNKVIVNLTIPIVTEEIDNVLQTYPSSPYQQAFTVPDLKLNLVVYVLNRISGIYAVVDPTKQNSIDNHKKYLSSERMLEIESLIHRGIREVMWNKIEGNSLVKLSN